MDSITLAWTLAATVLAGAQLFVQKIVAQERRDSALSGFFMYAISGLMALVVLISLREMPKDWLIISMFALMGGAVHGFGNFIRIEALKYIDAVIYFPINKMLGPLLVVVAGVALFAEHLTATQYIGIALSLTVPLLLISSVEHHRQHDLRRGLIFVIISTALTSASVLFAKQGLSYGSEVWFILGVSQLAGSMSSATIFFKQRGLHSLHLSSIKGRDLLLGVVLGVLGLFSYFTLLMAMKTGLISLVYVIQAHYILIPIVLSVWWYREHINTRKVVAIVVSLLAISVLYSG